VDEKKCFFLLVTILVVVIAASGLSLGHLFFEGPFTEAKSSNLVLFEAIEHATTALIVAGAVYLLLRTFR
jgi:hypothetical protein